jgi:hypothetical protein
MCNRHLTIIVLSYHHNTVIVLSEYRHRGVTGVFCPSPVDGRELVRWQWALLAVQCSAAAVQCSGSSWLVGQWCCASGGLLPLQQQFRLSVLRVQCSAVQCSVVQCSAVQCPYCVWPV